MECLVGDVLSLAANAPVPRDVPLWRTLSTLNPSISRPLTVEGQMSVGTSFGDPKDNVYDVADARVTLCRESVIKHIQSKGVEPLQKFVATRYNGVAVKMGEDIGVFSDSLLDCNNTTSSTSSSSPIVVTVKAEERINVFQSPWSNQFQSVVPLDAPMTEETMKRLQKESRILFSTRDLTLYTSHKKMNNFGDRIDGMVALERTLNVLLAAYAAQYYPSGVGAVTSAHVVGSSSTGTDIVIHTLAKKMPGDGDNDEGKGSVTTATTNNINVTKSWVAFHYVSVSQVGGLLKLVLFTRVRVAHYQPQGDGGGEVLDDELAILGDTGDNKVAIYTQQTKDQVVSDTTDDQLTHHAPAVASLICTMIEQGESTGIMPALDNIGASNAVRHAGALRGSGGIALGGGEEEKKYSAVSAEEIATLHKQYKKLP